MTQTTEVERVDPIPYNELLSENAKLSLEEGSAGGYYVGELPLLDKGNFLILDLSIKGEIWVRDGGIDVDPRSWGLYIAKEPNMTGNYGSLAIGPGGGILGFIYYFHLHRDASLTVKWDNLPVGTRFLVRYPDEWDGIIPANDPRFECDEVKSYQTIPENVEIKVPGTMCEVVN